MTTNDHTNKPAHAPTTGTPVAKQDCASTTSSSPVKAEKLHAEIKKHWNKLTDEEIKLYDKHPDQFFGKVKEKHGTSKEEAHKHLTAMKATCGCASEKAA